MAAAPTQRPSAAPTNYPSHFPRATVLLRLTCPHPTRAAGLCHRTDFFRFPPSLNSCLLPVCKPPRPYDRLLQGTQPMTVTAVSGYYLIDLARRHQSQVKRHRGVRCPHQTSLAQCLCAKTHRAVCRSLLSNIFIAATSRNIFHPQETTCGDW